MNIKILTVLLIMVYLIGIPQVQANRNIFNDFTNQYNVSNTKLNTCKTCMDSTNPPVSWNKYGLDLKNNPDFNRNNSTQAMKNIELLDSDGDKFTNIDEIHKLTFPGNESDYPVMPITTLTEQIQTDIPTPTQIQSPTITETSPMKTEPKPSDTIMNGLATLIMFVIVFFIIRKRKIS